MDGVRIINYSNIFLSCFMSTESKHLNRFTCKIPQTLDYSKV